MTNFEVIMKEHPQFVKECLAHTRSKSILEAVIEGNREHDLWYDKDKDRNGMNFLNAEYIQPVLDDVEKKYLSNIIRPFRHRVTAIRKIAWAGRCFIKIDLREESIELPYFSPDSYMYKNMKIGVHYTLDELGL